MGARNPHAPKRIVETHMQEPTTAHLKLLLRHPNFRIAARAGVRLLEQSELPDDDEIEDYKHMSSEDAAKCLKKLEKSAAELSARPAPEPAALEEAENAFLASEGPAFAYWAWNIDPETNAAKIKALVDQVREDIKRNGLFVWDTLASSDGAAKTSHRGNLH